MAASCAYLLTSIRVVDDDHNLAAAVAGSGTVFVQRE